MIRLFRVNSYLVCQIPPKPILEVVVARSPLVSTPRRAKILRGFLRHSEPQHAHYLQRIERSAD